MRLLNIVKAILTWLFVNRILIVRDTADDIKLRCFLGFIDNHLTPLKCTKCQSTSFRENTKETINSEISEFEVVCNNCNQVNGYWAYGHYQP